MVTIQVEVKKQQLADANALFRERATQHTALTRYWQSLEKCFSIPLPPSNKRKLRKPHMSTSQSCRLCPGPYEEDLDRFCWHVVTNPCRPAA